MSLRKAIRNARKASNYGIGQPPLLSVLERHLALSQGVSFDLTTEEGIAAARAWRAAHPGPDIPDDWDGSKIPAVENLMEEP